MFRDVAVAGAPGPYLLRCASASRKVALREAAITVEVRGCPPLSPQMYMCCLPLHAFSPSN